MSNLLDGLRLSLKPDTLADLDYHPLPWLPSYQLHLGVSRATPYAVEPTRLLDAGIEQLARSGDAARLQRQHAMH